MSSAAYYRSTGDEEGRIAKLQGALSQRFQLLLDKSVPHICIRWIAWSLTAVVYFLRAYFVNGFYIVTYGLGIYNLNLIIGFLSPQVDPESEGPALPTKSDQEFKPFVRRLPEFKFWYRSIKSFFTAFFMTFFSIFDVPVFWPILLLYWMILFFMTMKQQIKHMIKHRYIPVTFGKKKYDKKDASMATDAVSLPKKDDK